MVHVPQVLQGGVPCLGDVNLRVHTPPLNKPNMIVSFAAPMYVYYVSPHELFIELHHGRCYGSFLSSFTSLLHRASPEIRASLNAVQYISPQSHILDREKELKLRTESHSINTILFPSFPHL